MGYLRGSLTSHDSRSQLQGPLSSELPIFPIFWLSALLDALLDPVLGSPWSGQHTHV